MRVTRFAKVGALLVIGGALIAAPAAHAQASVSRVPFSTFQFNQCAAGELIEITGTLLVVRRDVGEHVLNEFVLSGAKGVAPSTGARYVAKTSLRSAFYGEPDGTPFVLTVSQHNKFVRVGEDGSFRYQVGAASCLSGSA